MNIDWTDVLRDINKKIEDPVPLQDAYDAVVELRCELQGIEAALRDDLRRKDLESRDLE